MQVLHHQAAIYVCSHGMVSAFLCIIVLEQDAIEEIKGLEMQNSIILILAPGHSD